MEKTLAKNIDRQKLKEFFTSTPVLKAYLFGSYAQGKEMQDSDIDILVELDKGVDLLEFIDIKQQLEELLGKEVDLVSTKGLNPRIAPFVHDSKELIYERENEQKPDTVLSEKAEILENVKEAVEELKLIKKGEMKAISAKDLLDEL